LRKFKNLLTPYRGLRKEVYVIALARMINAMGAFVWPMMSLLLTKKLGLTAEKAGLVILIMGLIAIPAPIIGGKLTDSIGRKKIIIIFDLIGISMYIACGFIKPSFVLIYLITFAGTCMSIAGPAHDSLMQDITTPENRKGAYGLSYMAFNLGFAIGPALGGFLFEKYLTWFFVGDALTTFAGLLLIFFFVKDNYKPNHIEEFDETREQEKGEEGSVFSVLLKRPLLIKVSLVFILYGFVYTQWSFLIPIHSSMVFGDKGAQYYGFIASLNGILVIIATPFITKLFEKANNLLSIGLGGALYGLSFAFLAYATKLWMFFAIITVFTIGEIIISVASGAFFANNTPQTHRGRVSSILGLISGSGYLVGSWISGNLEVNLGITATWIIIASVALLGGLLMAMLSIHSSKNSRSEMKM